MNSATATRNSRLKSVWVITASVCLIILMTMSQRANADEWTVHYDTSAMDDSKSVYLYTESLKPVPGVLGFLEVRPLLIIRCHENTTTLSVDWNRYISTGGIYNEEHVRYRVDDKPPKNATWTITTDFEATGLSPGSRSIPLIRQLVKAKRFIVEVTPFGSNSIQAEFNINGLDKRIVDVQKECGW